MLFSLSGDLKYNFYQVKIGGMVGLIFGYLALIFIGIATLVITEKVAIMLSLAVIISLIIMLNPKLPLIFNNTAFLYFTAFMIAPVNFAHDFGLIIIIFLFGSVLTNIVALKLLKIFPI